MPPAGWLSFCVTWRRVAALVGPRSPFEVDLCRYDESGSRVHPCSDSTTSDSRCDASTGGVPGPAFDAHNARCVDAPRCVEDTRRVEGVLGAENARFRYTVGEGGAAAYTKNHRDGEVVTVLQRARPAFQRRVRADVGE